MNLLEIRTQFVTLSGRYDMVVDTTDYSNNGADFYINLGQSMLDKMGISSENLTTLSIPIDAGDYSINFGRRCMSVNEVWANNGEERVKLEKVSFLQLKEEYYNLVSEITSGAPLYYTLANIRTLESTDRDTLGEFLNLTIPPITPLGLADYRGAILAPPADESYVIDIYGNFLQAELIDDYQESYWTIYSPELLIKASLYQLYILTGRNTDAATMLAAINNESSIHDKNNVEEEIAGINCIEGSIYDY